jgi:AcrR family transcriptional regulator
MTMPAERQKSRSLATQSALMDTAESLIAEKGIQNVSVKAIIQASGQKNESALQYHFKNLQGLIDAIHTRRSKQTHVKRGELLDELLSCSTEPTLRELCSLMVMPTYLLARENPDFRNYILGFSHEVAVTPESALKMVSRSGGGGQSGQKTGELLRAALTHLEEPTYRQRMEFAVRLSSVAMGHHARQKNAFRGKTAALFVSNLIDAIEGLLNAPASEESQAI